MLSTLINKYDSATIISFLCLGFIFGLNGCVQSSILLTFYQPNISCNKPSLSPFYSLIQMPKQQQQQQYQQSIDHSKHKSDHSQQQSQLFNSQYINKSDDKICNPCQEGYNGQIYLNKEYQQIYSMVEQFQWFCSQEYQKIIVMSMMASGLFIGFLTNFLVGDPERQQNNSNKYGISLKGMTQILIALYVQTIALLSVNYVKIWYEAGIILAIWNFGYSYFFSSVYSLISRKFGTLIIKYSSTIYHAIQSFVMIGFLIFIRIFSDWRDILFYFSGIPQGFFVLLLTITLCFQKKKESKLKQLNQTVPNTQSDSNLQLGLRHLNTEEQQNQQYFHSDVTEFNEEDQTKNQQQTFVLSRYQTEDFLLTLQINQTGNDVDSHHGTNQGNYFGGPSYSKQYSYQNQDSLQLNDNNNKSPYDSDSKKSGNAINTSGGRAHPQTSKNTIFENLKQKIYIQDLTMEQLKQQQEQFILHSDININLDQNTPNIFTLDNESKYSKHSKQPNVYYQSQLNNNTFERQDSSETQHSKSLRQSNKDIQSMKLMQNTPKNGDESPNLTFYGINNNNYNNNSLAQLTNPTTQGQKSISTINKFDQRELTHSDQNIKYPPNNNNNTFQQQIQPFSTTTLQFLQPTTLQANNLQTMKQEMKTRWMQLKRDRSQKWNILIFLCCWITANITNYGIYITLLFIQGDIFMKITLCIIIEIISNYLASFILIHFQLKNVILSLFFISGFMCLSTFFMDKTSELVLLPIFITKLCMELFFPIKTYFLQFVLHSQYFKISLGLGDTLSTFLQALMPLLIYISYSDKGYFLTFVGILMIFCYLMILQIELINIYGLNHQFSVVYKEENKQSNIRGLAEIMEVDSAADISLYSFQPPNH